MPGSQITTDRRRSKSLARLLEDEGAAKKAITNILIVPLDQDQSSDCDAIKARIADLKEAIVSYESASAALYGHYMKAGCVEEANEARTERLKLVYQECSDHVKEWNSLLRGLGYEATSSISRLSRLTNASNFINRRKETNPRETTSNPYPLASENQRNNDQFSTAESQRLSEGEEEEQIVPTHERTQMSTTEKVEKFLQRSSASQEPPSELGGATYDDQLETLDPVSRRHLKQELLRGSGEPFAGNSEQFWEWKAQILRRMAEAQTGPLDSMYVLQANTSGGPKKLISDKIAAFCRNPKTGLSITWKTLEQRYGNDIIVAQSLLSKLDNFPKIKNMSQVNDINSFYDLCTILQVNLLYCKELSVLNLNQGMSKVWQKMPDNFQHQWQNQFANHKKKPDLLQGSTSWWPF